MYFNLNYEINFDLQFRKKYLMENMFIELKIN